MSKNQRYICLLRGINVGGHNKIKMAELRKMFEGLGFENVKTVLATGNIGFDAPASKNIEDLGKQIHDEILRVFELDISVIMRVRDDIQQLVDSDPFADVEMTEDTRIYVSFLGDDSNKHNLKIPYSDPDGSFTIVAIKNGAACGARDANIKTVDYMSFLEKEFGKNITTRNWNTVLKIASL